METLLFLAVLLGILLLPATAAYFTNHLPSALTIATIPGGFCLLMGFRLWEVSQTRMDCGTGLIVVLFCLMGSGFSLLTTLFAAKLVQVKTRRTEPTGVGLTPESH